MKKISKKNNWYADVSSSKRIQLPQDGKEEFVVAFARFLKGWGRDLDNGQSAGDICRSLHYHVVGVPDIKGVKKVLVEKGFYSPKKRVKT